MAVILSGVNPAELNHARLPSTTLLWDTTCFGTVIKSREAREEEFKPGDRVLVFAVLLASWLVRTPLPTPCSVSSDFPLKTRASLFWSGVAQVLLELQQFSLRIT